MPPRPASSCDHDSGCITCGDEAIEMRVVRIDHDRELALCEERDGEGRETVEIALVQPVSEGDVLLVHAGTAIASLGSQCSPDGTSSASRPGSPDGTSSASRPGVPA